ncbi:MAG: hypothetical protein ABSC05_19980 [Candidatus Solibacter sp.]|jgi:hypothetical protein
MTFHLVHQHSLDQARSPLHIVEHKTGREVAWINRYLDRERVRRLAETTLRSYALDLRHFLRWWISVHHTDAVTEAALTESTLLDYVRFQSGQQPRPAAASITTGLSSPSAPCEASSPQPRARLHPASTRFTGEDLPWVLGALAPH